MTVKARITCENRPGLLPLFSTYKFNCRRVQLRTEEGEGLVSRRTRPYRERVCKKNAGSGLSSRDRAAIALSAHYYTCADSFLHMFPHIFHHSRRNAATRMGLIWRKDMNVTPFSSISSDRICGLCVKSPQPGAVDITIIGVYVPCSDMGMECYSEHHIELERFISEHQQHGPMVIMGDFNAHLGTLGGGTGIGKPNQQAILLHQLIARCNLHAVSLSSLSQGPQYTFQNSVSQTTVDYILVSHDTTEYIQQCFTHNSAPLNNSDHLPITAVLQVTHSTVDPQEQATQKTIHWSKALKGNNLCGCPKQVSATVAPLIGHSYSSAEELNKEIIVVSEKIFSAARQSLPLRKNSAKKRKWYKDQTLSRLASAKKAAWDKWSANGRPKEGPLYDAKTKPRAE